VDSILEASAQVLVEYGFRKFSTNRVARRAGVSIGTLYQYFPNKESLIAAIQQKHLDDLSAIMELAFATARDQELQAAIRTLVEADLEVHRVNPRLHRVLVDEVAKLDAYGEERVLDRIVTEGLLELLNRHRKSIRVPDLRLAVFLVMHIVESIVHAALRERPASINSGELTNELVRAVSGYLLHSETDEDWGGH
jgi:AcrR family transcriptional regulator